jgi:hypothetical protein
MHEETVWEEGNLDPSSVLSERETLQCHVRVVDKKETIGTIFLGSLWEAAVHSFRILG